MMNQRNSTSLIYPACQLASFVLKHATCQELPNSKISATLQDALSRAAHTSRDSTI